MRKRPAWPVAAALAVALAGGGCQRGTQLTRAPLDVGVVPAVMRLDPPLPSSGPLCELDIEFDRPGDSHHAADVRVAFVTADGTRDTLHDVRLDRRGESAVRQRGRLTLTGATGASPVTFTEMWTWSDTPVRVRSIRHHGG